MNKFKIKYVAQRQKKDCVIACLAMILPHSYEEIEKSFWTDFNRQGIALEHAANYLMDQGFMTVIKEARHSPNIEILNKEMWKPFASVHLVSAKQYIEKSWTHCLVMTSTGKVIDPASTKNTKNNFYEVIKVLGLFPYNVPKGKK